MEDKRIMDLDEAGKEEKFERILSEVKHLTDSKYMLSDFTTFLDGEASDDEMMD